MRPRGDLDHDHAVIIRRGISYGGDVTQKEQDDKKSDDIHERGLIFVCYQSDIRNGFNFLTTRKHLISQKHTVGTPSLMSSRLGKQQSLPRQKDQVRWRARPRS